MLLSSVNVERFTKSRFYIANKLVEKVREIKHQNMVQIITDNAQACKAAGAIMEGQYPYIFWTPCVVQL